MDTFICEADALFGKRTTVKDAPNKYANQESSYLMNRIEAYEGLIILSMNSMSKIHKKLLAKFDLVVNFD